MPAAAAARGAALGGVAQPLPRLALRMAGGPAVEQALDWILIAVAFVVLAASESAAPREGYVPKVVLQGTSYPLRRSTVPPWSVPLYSLALPLAAFAAHALLLRRPAGEARQLSLGLLAAVGVTAALTNLIKCPVGRLRPDFNARCWPDGVVVWAAQDAWGGYPACSGPLAVVAEGRKSFPSGHSSWSASGLGFLGLWALDRLQAAGAGAGHPWRLAVGLAPWGAALGVGVSRVADGWHHPADVAAGLALGAAAAWLSYRCQRPRLAGLDPDCYGGTGIGTGGAGAAGSRLLQDEDAAPLLQSAEGGGSPPV